jgi:predicted nucleic acid-binding protein
VTVLVDTPIWSFAFRRGKRTQDEQAAADEWVRLVRREEVAIIGAIRQEILSGVADVRQFEQVRATLLGFADLAVSTPDHEEAARLCNVCRRKGVQGSPTDFLICAVSLRYSAPIFTTDHDFARYAKHTGIRLHQAPIA